MVRVYLVDDEPLAIDRMVELCSRLEYVEVVGTTLTGEKALADIERLQPDLLLIDITMPDLDGFDVVEALRTLRNAPSTIFVTAHPSFAIQAFDVAASDYLLKPVELGRLGQAIDRAVGHRTSQRRGEPTGTGYATELWAPVKGGSMRIPVERLIFIEAQRDYVELHTQDQSCLLNVTLTELSQQLDPDAFVRVHRSFLVSRRNVVRTMSEKSGRRLIVMTNGAQVPVGRTYNKQLRPERMK